MVDQPPGLTPIILYFFRGGPGSMLIGRLTPILKRFSLPSKLMGIKNISIEILVLVTLNGCSYFTSAVWACDMVIER